MNEIHSIRNSYTGFPAKQRQSARIYPLGMLSRPLAALLLVLLILVNSSNCLPAVFASEQGLYSLVWSSLESEVTHNVAWADYDGDGDLDLAISNRDSSAIRLYRNNGDQLSPSADWSLSESGPHNGASIAWADVDDDGDLDIALGRWGAATRWYRSENGVLSTSPAWNSSSSQYTTNVAWGYLNNDNYPDLAISCENYGSGGIRVYTNNAGTLNSNPWVSPHDEPTRDLAWADIDKDGDLDLAAATGNEGFPKSNRLFRNDNGVLVSIWQSSESEISTGVAWGDFDGDGYPDLAVSNAGNPPTRIYQNISNGGGGRTLSSSGVWTAVGTNISYDVAWGDYDSDGDLDLITGTGAGGVYVYRNDGGSLGTSPVWFSPSASESTLTIALGDIDNDGDLDIAAGNGFGPNRLYRNHSTTLTNNAIWTSSLSDYSNSIAWGDVDHDGDLDLVVGGGCKFGSCNPSHLYQNNGGNLSLTVWFPSYLGQMRSVAWGDVDKDYDLELAVGNESGANYIFENSGSLLTNSPSWISSEGDPTQSVAWGDYDGDGDLDLAVGNGSRTNYSPDTYYGVPNRLYRNENGMLTASAVWSSAESDPTMEIAWGDYDADGDLDLVASNYLTPNRLYRNDHGILTTSAVWSSLDRDRTYGAAWSDYDGDGDLDLSVSNDAAPQKIYRNDGGVLSALATWTSVESLLARKIAWGDMDGDSDPDMLTIFHSNPSVALNLNDHGSISSFADWRLCDNCYSWYFWGGGSGDIDNDGDLDLAVANGAGIYDEYSQGHEMVFRNGRDSTHLPEAIPVVYIHQPGIYANYYATPFIWENQFIPISYTLSHSLSNPVKLIRAFYSLDGGGRWLPAIPTPATPIANLVTSPEGAEYLYNWDVFGSGFFGQSDNVVFRIEAVPAVINNPIQPPGFYRYSSYATQTYPFRVRGTQVRVISDTVPVPGALVYCLPAGQESGASLFSDLAGEPYRTDGQGYLQGRGQLGIGDQLVAMLPVTSTESYTLYHTSATPMASGLAMNEVTAAGVQTLTVTTENPLVLFDLDVSLQWDARYDHEYMAGLEYNLSRASELLYDWTDGQAALGEVRVFHNRQNWNDAHIRVYASNQLRPMALQGGIVGEVISDTQVLTMTYAPGQVHMGAMWSRYGGAGSSLGDDWPRALAHELGHYALYLNDNYIGLDESGQLIPVDTCPGAMADPYREDYSEFHPDLDWLPGCERTLSNQTTGRSDWATILEFYPGLAEGGTNAGPSLLPLAVTQIEWVEPVTPTQALADPTFYLVEDDQRVEPRSSTRAFLYQDGWAIDLGKPKQDRVIARGAKEGDRLCVYEPKEERVGCEIVASGDEFLELHTFAGWSPEIVVTPVNSVTVELEVGNLSSGLDLRAKLYPFTGPEVMSVTLGESGVVYSATFDLDEPTLEGYLQVWVEESEPRREAIVDFAVGGNPGRMRGSSGRMRGSGGRMRGSSAPVMSSDGYVMLFADETQMEADEFYTLQAASLVPEPPPWSTVVGNAYRLSASQSAPDLSAASVSFAYLGGDVPEGEEDWLRVYFRAPLSTTWQVLPTALDVYYNTASAPSQGEGLYALMSSLEIPLEAPGWNLFAYPVQATRPVSDALRSIEDYYGMVYGYKSTDASDPWKVYSPYVPSYVNDLYELEFGHGYWISVTQAITLYLKGASEEPLAPMDAIGGFPPSTYYGEVLAGDGFTPGVGMPVTAWVGGKLCGQGATRLVVGKIVYVVDVLADGWGGAAGCGAPGKTVTFKVGEQIMQITAAWDNRRLWNLDLYPPGGPLLRVFLPLVRR